MKYRIWQRVLTSETWFYKESQYSFTTTRIHQLKRWYLGLLAQMASVSSCASVCPFLQPSLSGTKRLKKSGMFGRLRSMTRIKETFSCGFLAVQRRTCMSTFLCSALGLLGDSRRRKGSLFLYVECYLVQSILATLYSLRLSSPKTSMF